MTRIALIADIHGNLTVLKIRGLQVHKNQMSVEFRRGPYDLDALLKAAYQNKTPQFGWWAEKWEKV